MISGTIVEISFPLSYIVETYPGITFRRKLDKIRSSSAHIPSTIQREYLPKWFPPLQVAEPASTSKDSVPNSSVPDTSAVKEPTIQTTLESTNASENVLRRSTRQPKPTKRFINEL